MTWRAQSPDDTREFLRGLLDELAELRAWRARCTCTPDPAPPKYVLRATQQNINGVNVIVGLVQPEGEEPAWPPAEP